MAIPTYTREGFRRRLAKMPPDRQFCKGGYCPIATFYLNDEDEDEANSNAQSLDSALVEAIDTASGSKRDWKALTPRVLLALIAVVKAEEKKRSVYGI